MVHPFSCPYLAVFRIELDYSAYMIYQVGVLHASSTVVQASETSASIHRSYQSSINSLLESGLAASTTSE